jgi:mono/diheme cytochrome c family protein
VLNNRIWDSSKTRRALLLRLALVVATGSGTTLHAADAPPVFKQYCVQCHNKAMAMAGINLQKLTADRSIGAEFKQWQKVLAMLEEKNMPPENMPQPNEAERTGAAAWIRTALQAYAEEHAGDPGNVTVRRLTSGEYANTISDLTGLALDVERAFAGDAVGGEGFTNFGDVQFMADATLENYLSAAKTIADHAVIGSGPLGFFADPGMSGFELSAITRIHDIYRTHGFRAVAAEGGRAFGLEQYGKAFFACWQYRHRRALGDAGVSLEVLAQREGLSPRFVRHIWDVVQQSSPSYPTSEVVSRWQGLPAPEGDNHATAKVRQACTDLQEYAINWPRWLFAAGELARGGAGDERALVITDAALAVDTKHELTFLLLANDEGSSGVTLSLIGANPASTAHPIVVWRNPTVCVVSGDRDRGPKQPLKSILPAELVDKLAFGRRPDGGAINPSDFATEGETSLSLDLPLPKGARGMQLSATVDVAPESLADAVLRLTVSDNNQGKRTRTPAWALLANAENEGYRTWKANVLEYAANLPQTSHGEPTPSDRDPIPPPFDNTYNQDERDHFHARVKYFRDDQFFVDNMIDDATRHQLDDAWDDLYASFEYHNIFLRFVAGKYGVELAGKGIDELDEALIADLPDEPRHYVKALKLHYESVMKAQAEAHSEHVDESIRFAELAWRRPLDPAEEDRLRRFYTNATEDGGLEHRKAIRALLARILVAPEFLYRLERPADLSGTSQLSDWEVASRLSYFLWSSVPDEELRRAAAAGELNSDRQLTAQVKRMLADPKARRFATEFFGQWLGFYRFDQYKGVDAKRYPDFTDEVKSAMYDEAVSFFEHLVRQDRPVREILSADYTFLNQALAKHYGIETAVTSNGPVEKVDGADGIHRGGLLRLGAVLTTTSAPLRTSPVKRGDWVLRRVLGTPTPPPPPDAGSLPADDKLFGDLTMAQQLEAHRRNPSCNSCHSRIDPLGFALERYDAVGRWRDEYSDGKPIEDQGKLSDQRRIDGINGLIAYLGDQDSLVLRTMANKLLGYALGRTVALSDQPLIDRLIQRGGDATFAELAADIVLSRQFRYHRGREEGPAAAIDDSTSEED